MRWPWKKNPEPQIKFEVGVLLKCTEHGAHEEVLVTVEADDPAAALVALQRLGRRESLKVLSQQFDLPMPGADGLAERPRVVSRPGGYL